MNSDRPNNSLLTTLASSGHAWVQFGTLALIALTGFGNWAATWKSADRNKEEIEISRKDSWESEQRIKAELVRQVSDMHDWMRKAINEFHQGNEDSAANRQMLTKLTQEMDELKRQRSSTP
jgi:hypothetical protein